MKRSVFTLLALFACTIYPVKAYEYFTIYFSDGTKSEAFYATDVDSICYSKLSLDSIAYDEWQVQEIYTCDSIYRYPLAQIDSLSFKDVDINKVAEDIDRASNIIVPIFAECKSAEELSQHLSTILNVEGVEDAWVDGQSLYVDIRDYGSISFIYPPALVPLESQYEKFRLSVKRAASLNSNEHNHIDVQRVCIYNQTVKDENSFFDAADDAYNIIYGMNYAMGFSCDPFTNLTPKFFQEDIFNYDQIFLLTHGEYDIKHNLHWIYTSEELLCVEKENWLSNISATTHLFNKYPFYSPYLIGCAAHKEIRNGKPCVVYYTKISEKFISSSPNRFKHPGNAMIFNAACQSLKGNNNMAKVFINKGAGCYIGYNETNNIGHGGAEEFCAGLLNGSSVQGSFYCIPSKWKEQMYETDNACYPVELKIIKSNEKIMNSCIVDIETLEPENKATDIKFRGKIKMLNTSIVNNYKFGFQLSTNSNMSQAKDIGAEDNYDSSTLYMNWEKTIDDNDLEPNTTYYYRAYMYDGYSNCYGEIKSFTTKEDGSGTGEDDLSNYVFYFVRSNDGKTKTYYFDDKFYSRKGILDYWDRKNIICDSESIIKVVLDSSLKKYEHLEKIVFQFCDNLEEIEGLNNLYVKNTTWISFYRCSSLKIIDLSGFDLPNCSKLTFCECNSLTSINLSNVNTPNLKTMNDIFAYCSSLTSLDLSGFNTSNVTDMNNMFYYCRSLNSLDLSHLNTSNVTNMRNMFGCCSSLTSLDVSSFDTSNVTDMEGMFGGCSSLNSLDVSNFETSNVTNMKGMFSGCSSLTSLDVRSFNTSKVTNMYDMFGSCSSLTSLDLSSFDTSNVMDMRFMFSNCSSLKTIYAVNWFVSGDMYNMFMHCNNLIGGKGTKIGENLYYNSAGELLHYYCSQGGEAAHIDGGKDNPGLFTEK